jgi:hypothetical protein
MPPVGTVVKFYDKERAHGLEIADVGVFLSSDVSLYVAQCW